MAGMVALSSSARGAPPPSGTRKSTRACRAGFGASVKSLAIASASSPANGSTRAARSRASPWSRRWRASFTAPDRIACASRATPASASRDSTSGSATSGMGTTLPSGLRTVSPAAHARPAAARPISMSASDSKMGSIRSSPGVAARVVPLIGKSA